MRNYHNLNRRTIMILCLILSQIVVVLINGAYGYYWPHMTTRFSFSTVTIFSLFASVFIGISTIYILKEIIRMDRLEYEAKINKIRLEENKDLIDVLRSNRHDFANHLQVVMGLIQLGKNEAAMQYIQSINEKLGDQSSIGNIKNLGVAALLLKKQGVAEQNAVKFIAEIKSDLENLPVQPSDMIRILGNLLDNAIYAASNILGDGRWVKVGIYNEKNNNKFVVANGGPIIESDVIEKIFEKGFTTKEEKGSGLGLYIVKQIVEKYGGSVSVSSSEGYGTSFTVVLPRFSDKLNYRQAS